VHKNDDKLLQKCFNIQLQALNTKYNHSNRNTIVQCNQPDVIQSCAFSSGTVFQFWP